FETPSEARVRGERGRLTIERGFSEDAVAKLIEARLGAISRRRNLAAFRDEKWQAYRRYTELVSSIAATVEQFAPAGGTVLVISKGDDRLLQLHGRKGRHFPSLSDGTYSGFYPADDADAIDQLEALRLDGGNFFLIPYTAFWWLDYYPAFAAHLNKKYRVLR